MSRRWRRRVYGPLCFLMRHEALGMMSSEHHSNDRDSVFCACTRREHTHAWYATMRGRA